MENSLENLSKVELLTLLQKQEREAFQHKQQIEDLKFQVEYYRRLAFGQKRERFEGDKNQLSLPFEMDPETSEKQQEEVKEKLTYERRKRTEYSGESEHPIPV